MSSTVHDNETGNGLRVCIIIPTYNNEKTLRRVLDGVLGYTTHIIVVNDGATDSTSEILKNYPQLTVIDHAANAGKGTALANGFRKARELGYDHAITIDSDGQHFPSDIPAFLDAIRNEPETLFIGSRNMGQAGVPKKSSFGNKFSNFWFWFETGTKLEDTQSGYRAYPLHLIPKRFFTTKFEFEIEVIVRSAWKGIPVKNIPVKVLYDPGERVSHFRPFRDFTRISILNTVLVHILLFYIKPRDAVRSLKKKGLKRFLLNDVLQSGDSNTRKALSIGLGAFMAVSPFWGFHAALALLLAAVLKLNKAIAFAFSNISPPPIIPFVIYASMKAGSLLTHRPIAFRLDKAITFADMKQDIINYLPGSIILATVVGIAFGGSGFLILSAISFIRNRR